MNLSSPPSRFYLPHRLLPPTLSSPKGAFIPRELARTTSAHKHSDGVYHLALRSITSPNIWSAPLSGVWRGCNSVEFSPRPHKALVSVWLVQVNKLKHRQSVSAHENLWNFEMRILGVHKPHSVTRVSSPSTPSGWSGTWARLPRLSCCQQKILNQRRRQAGRAMWWNHLFYRFGTGEEEHATHVFYCAKIHTKKEPRERGRIQEPWSSDGTGIVCVWREEKSHFMAYQFRSLSYKFAEEGKNCAPGRGRAHRNEEI